MSKKIVFINQSSGYLMIDILNAFSFEYDEVVLVVGSLKVMERNLNHNIRIKKIIPYNRNTSITRILTWIISTVQIYFLLLFRFRKYEVIFSTNPPLAYLTSIFLPNKFSIIVYDTYPDALKNIGIQESNVTYKFWQRLNKKVFFKATCLYTLSQSMSLQLSDYVNKDKLKIIHNWSGSEKFKPIDKKANHFIAKEGLGNKFIVLYSGNIGYTHSVEVILEVANMLKYEENILFMFIGEGRKKSELIKYVENYSLKNCKFLTWQSSDILPFSLASADLGVVTLNEQTASLSVPSKTYNLLACGIPLLSIAPDNSELVNLVKKYNNGRNFSANQIQEIAEFVLHCKKNRDYLNELANNSIIASKDFTYENAKLYL